MSRFRWLLAALLLVPVLAACDPPPPEVPSAGVCTGRTADGGAPLEHFPGAACTGVVNEAALVPSGDVWVTVDGAIVENLSVEGNICVQADNVTIRNVRVVNGVVAAANLYGYGFCGTPGGAQNLDLIDVEIRPNMADSVAIEGAVYRPDISCVRCNIHRTGAAIAGGLYTLTDTYIHDLLGESGCVKYPTDCMSHNDGIQIGGAGGDVFVAHSTIEGTYAPESTGGGMSCAICIYSHDEWGPVDNVMIYNSRIASEDAVYCAYGGESGQQDPTGVTYDSNQFVRSASSGGVHCGTGGPITAWLASPSNVWDDNTYEDGQPVG